jgi:zinc and cadmium transporter
MIVYLQLLLLALLGSVIALAGGVVFLYQRDWAHFLERHSVPFAAGVLITVSLVGLLPEAVHMAGESAFLIVLITFFTAYLFEHVFFGIHHHDDHQHGRNYQASIPLVLFGDTIHNFIDGVAIGAAFFAAPGLGLVTALSTFLHEVPHEIGDFGILLKAGWKKGKIVWVNVISASATIVGAFALLFFVHNEGLIGGLLAISSGVFLYLGASDFLPHIEDGYRNKVRAVVPMALGVLIMLISLMLVPHTHEENEVHDEEWISTGTEARFDDGNRSSLKQ